MNPIEIIQSPIKDAITDRTVYPALILLCVILIWVGSNMMLTHFLFDAGDETVMVRNGGIVLTIGLLLGGGVNYWRSSKI